MGFLGTNEALFYLCVSAIVWMPAIAGLLAGAVLANRVIYMITGFRTKSRLGIELNGIANMHAILDSRGDSATYEELVMIEKLKFQLNILERYLLNFRDVANEEADPAPWHEVRENPERFKNLKERVYAAKTH